MRGRQGDRPQRSLAAAACPLVFILALFGEFLYELQLFHWLPLLSDGEELPEMEGN